MHCVKIIGLIEKELGQTTIYYLQIGANYLFLGRSELTIKQTKYVFLIFSGNGN